MQIVVVEVIYLHFELSLLTYWVLTLKTMKLVAVEVIYLHYSYLLGLKEHTPSVEKLSDLRTIRSTYPETTEDKGLSCFTCVRVRRLNDSNVTWFITRKWRSSSLQDRSSR